MLTAIALSSSCFSARPIYIEDEKKTAERTIELFHSRLSAEEYEAIYGDLHEEFKQSSKKETILESIRTSRNRLGRIDAVTGHWVNYIMGDPVPIRAIYNLRCENGDFIEWFGYAMSSTGKAQLVQYQTFPGVSAPPNADSK